MGEKMRMDDGKCSDERGLVINNRWKNRVGTKE